MSLRVWLPLNGDLNNQGLDDITVANNGATIDNNGKIGKCYSFDGSNDYFIGNPAPLNSQTVEWSYCCWFKPNKLHTGCLFSNRTSVSETGITIFYYNNYIYFDDGVRWSFIPSTAISIENWNHLVFVRKINCKQFYLNGVLINETSTVGTNNNNMNSTHFTIGMSQSNNTTVSGNMLNGKLNDVRIYDHALSPLEVKHISQGLVLHYPLNRNGWGQENLATCNTVQYNLAASTGNWNYFWITSSTALEPNTTYTFSAEVEVSDNYERCTVYNYTASGKSGEINYYFPADGKRHSWTFTTTSNALGVIAYAGTAGSTANYSAIYKKIKLEKGSIATPWCPNSSDALATTMGLNDNIEYDTSGYGNNGTRTGTFSWTSDTPKYQVSTKIAASASGIKLTNFSIGNIWSMSVWFKYPSQDNTGWKALVILNNNGSDSDLQFGNYINCSDGRIQYSANGKYDSTNVHATFGEWNHLVSTYDGTTLRCYFNGEYRTSLTPGQTLSNRSNLGIGFKSNALDFSTFGASMTNGLLSDVRIYATALSADDVKSLYQNSAYIDNQGNIYGAVYEEV